MGFSVRAGGVPVGLVRVLLRLGGVGLRGGVIAALMMAGRVMMVLGSLGVMIRRVHMVLGRHTSIACSSLLL